MPCLKRPYPHGDSGFTRTPCIAEKRRLVAIPEADPSVASPRKTTSINGHNKHGVYCDENLNTEAISLTSCISSPSSADSREVPSPTNITCTPLTTSSNTDTAEKWNEGDEEEICFGMLVNGLLSAWKSFSISATSGSKGEALILKPRFRANGITIINSAIKEIGVLDNDTARGMIDLKTAVSSVRFDIYVCQGTKQAQGQDERLGIPLEILVFGSRSSLDQVGSLLSQFNLFLQEPVDRQISVSYKNPHVFSWDGEEDDTTSSYLLEPASKNHIDFTEKVQAVLNDTVIPKFSFQVKQDARITSTLKQHQLVALKFMISREGLEKTDRLTLWRPVHRNGRQVFRNEITHSTKSVEPAECRGGILADEMGMGKSLSLLALIIHTLSCQRPHNNENEYLASQQKDMWSPATLIIAPKSTIQGWKQQVNEHTRSGVLKVHIYHGDGRRISRDSLLEFDIVLTTYQTAASDASTTGILVGISWLRIVLDEAHQIRNRSTRIFRELAKLRAERRWCLTGTPVQNKLSDLFSLTQFLGFTPLENHTNARKYILEPLSRENPEGLENLRLALQTISLRRTKDLCRSRRKIEAIEPVTLNDRERRYYDTTLANAKQELRVAMGKSQGEILLRAISTLRRICSHGGAIIVDTPDIQHNLEQNICDKCEQIIDYQNGSQQTFHGVCGHIVCYECAIDEDDFENTSLNCGFKGCSVCLESTMSNLNNDQRSDGGQVNSKLVDCDTERAEIPTTNSSKINKVVAHLRSLEQASSASRKDPIKSLIFSHWSRTLDCLEQALSCSGHRFARIDGHLSIEQRRTVIHQFNSDPEIRILLLSYGAGSVGYCTSHATFSSPLTFERLNLQAATHVHLLEPHWNPMVEAQAAARVDRLDQLKDVYIYRYIVQDSIEERIQKTQRSKLQDAELSVSRMATGEDTVTDANDFRKLRDLL